MVLMERMEFPTMDLVEADQLARSLMRRHVLDRRGWTLEWGNAKRNLGVAIESRRDTATNTVQDVRVIRLSRPLMRLNSEAEVRDTILHEIAHALVGAAHGHDAVWQAKCREIGADPERLAGPGIRTPPKRWAVHCGLCDALLFERHRRPQRRFLARVGCRGCGERSFGEAVLRVR